MAVIRYEVAGDEAQIDEVLRSAFPTDAEARLVMALRASERLTLSLVAEDEIQIVGQIAFSSVSIEGISQSVRLWGLAPLAVRPEHQHQGIGRDLIQRGLAECQVSGIDAVVVLGEPEYYHRFNFCRARDYRISNEYGVDDAFMVVELRPGSLAQVKGTAQYAPEFADL